jgi:hypothetical protein
VVIEHVVNTEMPLYNNTRVPNKDAKITKMNIYAFFENINTNPQKLIIHGRPTFQYTKYSATGINGTTSDPVEDEFESKTIFEPMVTNVVGKNIDPL